MAEKRDLSQLEGIEYVAALMESKGGTAGLKKRLDEFGKIYHRFNDERERLIEKHPRQWVAMSKDGVITLGDSMQEVADEAKGRGYDGSDFILQFLDPDPPIMIL